MSERLEPIGWPVETERLSIRRATAGDVEATWRFRQLDAVNRWITSAPATIEAYSSYFLKPERLGLVLVVELEGVVIGDLMLKIEDGWGQSEVVEQTRGVQAVLGWAFDPAYGGRGYATEAVRELVRICFEELGLRRIEATCFADNEASWRLMERIGLRREANSVGDSLHRDLGWIDGVGYGLLAQEWRAQQKA